MKVLFVFLALVASAKASASVNATTVSAFCIAFLPDPWCEAWEKIPIAGRQCIINVGNEHTSLLDHASQAFIDCSQFDYSGLLGAIQATLFQLSPDGQDALIEFASTFSLVNKVGPIETAVFKVTGMLVTLPDMEKKRLVALLPKVRAGIRGLNARRLQETAHDLLAKAMAHHTHVFDARGQVVAIHDIQVAAFKTTPQLLKAAASFIDENYDEALPQFRILGIELTPNWENEYLGCENTAHAQ